MKNLRMIVNPADRRSHINREIYGNFSEHLGRCIYGGFYVGEDSPIPNTDGIRNDVVEAFKKIKLPVLRWPGGCFADEYHWKDGIGEKSGRKKMVNTNWGGVTEDNSFGTHEFMRLCELIGCEPYIAGNVGSGTVQELSEWIEYMTFDGISPMADLRRKNGQEKPWKLKYLGIGNENWGCGGNMRAEYYADVYRRFQSFCKNYSGNKLFKIACGPGSADYDWTEKLMKNLKGMYEWTADAISLHFYSIKDWNNKGKASVFDDDKYYELLETATSVDTIITRNKEIMDRFDPEHKIGLIVDEWGTWFDVEEGTNPGFLYQQNTMRDAMVAAISLDIFNRHSDRVIMANIAQAVNVLQAVILTEGEKMVTTPTYHVFDLYKEHQDNTLIYSYINNEKIPDRTINAVSQTVSVSESGAMHITLSNCSLTEEFEIKCGVIDTDVKTATARILTGDAHDLNDFENPGKVTVKPYEVSISGGDIIIKLPPCSVVAVEVNE